MDASQVLAEINTSLKEAMQNGLGKNGLTFPTAVPVLRGSPVNTWFPDKLFANFSGYSKGHAAVNN
jgi:hypothetical protein